MLCKFLVRVVVHANHLHLVIVEERPVALPERGRAVLRSRVQCAPTANVATCK